MNNGSFAGYVGRNAELKDLPSGQKVLNFSLGVSIGFGDKKETLWVSCALWGERGEKLQQYIVKGTPVVVAGDVTVRAYAAKDGTPKAELVCNVQRLTLMGRSDKGSQQAEQTEAKPAQAAIVDDDIPF
jgi:single-strand DNA-binding protein